MMKHLQLFPMACLVLLTGCALHTPYKVLYGTVDFNSERHLSAQVESYDHLPLKPVRVKLMRWGYNVGPLPSGTGTCGLGTHHFKSRSRSDACEPEMMMDGYALPPTSAPESPAAAPAPALPPPPIPPADVGSKSNPSQIRAAGFQSGNATGQANHAAGAAWLFGREPVRRTP